MNRIFSMVMLLLAGSCCGTEPESITLVNDGIPKASIILPEKPTQSAQLAAFELREHIKMITGAELPILSEENAKGELRIFIGDTKKARELKVIPENLKREEYVIQFAPDAIVMAGRDEQVFTKIIYDPENPAGNVLPSIWAENGTLNAVYDFLEHFCNVRWFNPTELGIIVPRQKTLTIKAKNIKRSPFFIYRHATYVDYDQHMTLWQPDTKEFYEWEAMAFPTLKKKYSDPKQFIIAKRNADNLYLLRMRSGGEYAHTNHSYYNYYDRFWQKNPAKPEAFEAAHPEYFAQGYGSAKPQQLCYSSSGLITQSAKDAAEYFKKNAGPGSQIPTAFHHACWGKNFFAIVPMDNFAYCKCPGCVKKMQDRYTDGETDYNRSPDLIFGFVNEVAREVKKNNPDKFVSCLAYLSYMDLPSFKLEDNIIVHVCIYNSRFPTFLQKEQFDILTKWCTKENRPIYLWLYNCFPKLRGKNGQYHCFPGFNAHCYGEQYKTFKKLGVKGMFYDGFGEEVDAYIILKLMNDPDLDVDTLFNEYFTSMFGPAAKPVREMYLEIEKIYNDKNNYPEGYKGTRVQQTEEVAWDKLGTAERMKKLGALMAEAKKLAVSEPFHSRVALWEKGIWDFMVAGKALYEKRMKASLTKITAQKIPEAQGNPLKVDWSKIHWTGEFKAIGSDKPAARMFSACIAHDGKYLYIQLSDPCDTSKLVNTNGVFLYDDWEMFAAKKREDPSRQYAFNSAGEIVCIGYKKDGNSMGKYLDVGAKVINQVTADKWIAYLVLPLETMLEEKVVPGEKIYINVIRVTNPALSANKKEFEVSSMTSFFKIRELDRLGEITLAE